MKNIVIRLLLALVVMFLSACVAPENALVRIRIGGGSGGGYAGQPQVGQQNPQQGDMYVKNQYLVGKETHGYHPQVEVQSKEGLDLSAREKLKNELDAWAIKKVDNKEPPPTDEEFTKEAQRRAGTLDVQARAGNSFNNTTTAVPRELVSRKVVDPSTLTPTERSEAQRRFYENLQHHTPPQ